MKISVIHYRSTLTESTKELLNAIVELGHEPVYLKIHELDAGIEGSRIYVKQGVREIDVDGGVVRSLGFSLSLEQFIKRIGVLEALETKAFIINKVEALVKARDKWRSLLTLVKKGINVPDTLVTENPYSSMRFTEARGRAVIKPIVGSLGLGSTLAVDPDVAYHISRGLHNNKIPCYIQVFLEKPGYDFRVFVVGDRVIGAMKRVISSGWKTNIAQGAVGVKVEEKDYPEVFEIALKSSKALGLDYAGVDIAYDKVTDKFYVLELNAFPQWRGLRAATGVNVAKHIIEYVVENIRR